MPTLSRAGWRWLAPLLVRQRGALAGLLALSLLVSASVLVQPWLTKLLIDEGLIARDIDTVWRVALTMLLVAISANLLGGLNRYWYTRVSGRLLFALREDVFAHLQQVSPIFLGRQRSGDLLARLDGDIAEIQRFSIDSLFAAVSGLFGLLGTGFFLWMISPDLSLLVLALIPVQWFYLRVMRTRVQSAVRSVRERSSDISAFLVERLPALKFIQTFGAGARESARLQSLNGDYLRDLLRLQLTEFATSAVPSALTSLLRTTVFIIGGYRVVDGQMQVGELIAFSTYLGMIMGPVQSLLGVYMAFNRVQVNLERVQWLRDTPVQHSGGDEQQMLADGPVALRFEDVCFRYPDSTAPIINHLTASCPAGSHTAIQGVSGSGKSTLTDLLLRHCDPDSGRILINGIDLQRLHPVVWRQRIAAVTQDITLFRLSLLDNVRYVRPQATSEQVVEALQQAGLRDLLMRLPEGIHTVIGERGNTLSGGEQQRVAIARALLLKPSLLILDEATSALDPDNERAILAQLDVLFPDCTRLTISHRDAPRQGAQQWLQLGSAATNAADGPP